MSDQIPFFQPDISAAELAAVTAVLQSRRLADGICVEEFEDRAADVCNCSHAVATNTGTAALHLALLALGIGPGDQVITSAFGYVATINAITYTGATPVLVDIDPITMNLDAARLDEAITEHTRAIIATATLGNPTGIERAAAVAARHEIPLIENVGEAFATTHKRRPVGSFGRLAVFSLHADRPITTGEGGLLVTNDDTLADLARTLRNHGQTYAHHRPPGLIPDFQNLGFNYRMPELSAAVGIAQLDRLDDILRTRRQLAAAYFDRLMAFPELILPTIDHDTQPSWYTFTVRLERPFQQIHRDRLLAGMRRHDIMATSLMTSLHDQPCYADRFDWSGGRFPVASTIASRTFSLPFFNEMDRMHVDQVAQTLRIMLDRELIALEAEALENDTQPPSRDH